MYDFSFSIPQNIIVGAGSLKKLGETAEKLGGKKGLIISGPHLNKIGVVDSCIEYLKSAGVAADRFTEVEANPSVDTVEKAVERFKECGADFIVAIGGGSPMDVAKAVGVVARYGGSITRAAARFPER
jgi:alcohol dehydrogenase